MRFWVLVSCCLAASVQAQDANLESCLNLAEQRAEQQVDIRNDCPALYKELQDDGLLTSVEPAFSGKVGLVQMELLADSRRGILEHGRLRQDGLDRLLKDILTVETEDPELSWWQAILKWLDGIKPVEHEVQYQWLQRWVKAIMPSKRAIRIFIYVLVALLAILSVWLVASELYRAGFFRKFSGGRKPLAHPGTQITPSSSSNTAFDELTPRGEIAALLTQLIDALAQRQLVPVDPSLTHRQLADCLREQPCGLKTAFSRLVYESEPLLYGNHPIDRNRVGDYRHEIRELLGQIAS